ncbi:MAG: hypothetical protein WC998_05935 [Candidatus Paceibacterota bacterium]|jgi:hypothetical protein
MPYDRPDDNNACESCEAVRGSAPACDGCKCPDPEWMEHGMIAHDIAPERGKPAHDLVCAAETLERAEAALRALAAEVEELRKDRTDWLEWAVKNSPVNTPVPNVEMYRDADEGHPFWLVRCAGQIGDSCDSLRDAIDDLRAQFGESGTDG